MNMIVHHIFGHFDRFPETSVIYVRHKVNGSVRILKTMERYQGRWSCHMISDYYWTLVGQT